MTQITRGGNETVAAITLAVATTGNDVDGTRPKRIVGGDWSAKPFATIQMAIDSVPKMMLHDVTITIGAGSFAGFDLRNTLAGTKGFRVNRLTIQGTLSLSTLASGLNTGTAVNGSDRELHALAGWTEDDLVGRYVRITSGPGAGNLLIVAKNKQVQFGPMDRRDVITFAGYGATMGAGSVFEILDGTQITSVGPNGYAGIYLDSVLGCFTIENFRVSSCTYGVVGLNVPASTFTVRQITVTGGYYGFIMQDCDRPALSQVGAINSTYVGIYLISTKTGANQNGGWLVKGSPSIASIRFDGVVWGIPMGVYVRGGAKGLYVWGCSGNIGFYRAILDGCGTGVLGYMCPYLEVDTIEINSCTVGPFGLFNCNLYVQQLTGSGNAGWGLYAAGSNNTVILDDTPTISATEGDATVDGINEILWDDLSESGDYEVNLPTNTRIFRE